MSNAYRELMRRKVLADICDRLSDDDKRTLIKAMERDRDWSEISQSLQRQEAQLSRIEKSQNWFVDFGSDVAANFLTDGLIWLCSKLFRKL